MTGVPQAMASTTLNPNGSSKLMRCSSAIAPPEQVRAHLGTDGAHVPNALAVEARCDAFGEVRLVLHDARDHQRQTHALGDVDRLHDALVRMDPAEEQQVVVRRSQR